MASVQTFGKKKSATAVAHIQQGKGLLKINGVPITLVQPTVLKDKVYEALTVVGLEHFQGINVRIRVNGGGHVSQIYAIRQAIAKGLVAYHQKHVSESSKQEIKKAYLAFDKTLLVADKRRMEPKKAGGKGARSKFQKSYR
ncbi:small ribosomal subunit protein uS9B [Diutina catenulata]